jgi:hypothetical protein
LNGNDSHVGISLSSTFFGNEKYHNSPSVFVLSAYANVKISHTCIQRLPKTDHNHPLGWMRQIKLMIKHPPKICNIQEWPFVLNNPWATGIHSAGAKDRLRHLKDSDNAALQEFKCRSKKIISILKKLKNMIK